MAPEVTKMVIKVDLACEKCRKKIKKVLCDIPQIQNQIYDEKANTVMITVESCSPEKVKKKIYCKGGTTVKCVEIPPNPPPKPPPTTPPKTPPKPPPNPPPKPPPCCKECCKGGPCWAGCRRSCGPCCYCGCGGPVCNCWGAGCNKCYYPYGYTVYICEENPSACTIM